MVQTRISYLRSRYNHHVTAQTPKKPSWFSLMHEYLGPIEQRRKASIAQKRSQSQCRSDASALRSGLTYRSTKSVPVVLSTSIEEPLITRTQTARSSTTSADRLEQQLKIIEQLNTVVQKSMLDLRNLTQEEISAGLRRSQRRDSIEDGHEFKVFGRNVGLQLGQMPLDVALHCQLAIQGVLRTFRLRQHNQIQQREQHQQEQHQQQEEPDLQVETRIVSQHRQPADSHQVLNRQECVIETIADEDEHNDDDSRHHISSTDHEQMEIVAAENIKHQVEVRQESDQRRNIVINRRNIAAFVDIASDSDDGL